MHLQFSPRSTARTIRKSGFTLIELLVVIAIIAILAAILFPVFARARENARRASCQSNLKQISLGIRQYQQDFDETFPRHSWGQAATAAGPYGWADSIQPYLKALQIYQCPSESKSANSDPTKPGGSDPTAADYTDYWYNSALSTYGTCGASTMVAPKIDAALEYPSLTIMLGDGNSPTTIAQNASTTARYHCNGYSCAGVFTSGAAGLPTAAQSGFARAGGLGGPGMTRHLEGQVFAFADGHVKWYKSNAAEYNVDLKSGLVYNANVSFGTSNQSPTFTPKYPNN